MQVLIPAGGQFVLQYFPDVPARGQFDLQCHCVALEATCSAGKEREREREGEGGKKIREKIREKNKEKKGKQHYLDIRCISGDKERE